MGTGWWHRKNLKMIIKRSDFQAQIFEQHGVLSQDTIKASTHQHSSLLALESNPVLICHRPEKCVIHKYYLISCLGVSFQDPLDNSLTCECTPEETDSSENSQHPDFAKVIKLTFCYANNFELAIAFMEKMEMLPFKI